MATPDLDKRAKEAFVDDDFELAVDLYTQALELDPECADLYADRAQANIKLSNFTEAVADANKAIELDRTMSKAYLRKGIACIKIEEYQTAKAALEAGLLLTPGDSRFARFIKECEVRIAEEDMDLHKAPTLDASSSPDKISETAKDSEPTLNGAVVTEKPKPKYRHDYFNTPTEVVLTIFAKGIPPENVSVDFGVQTLRVVIEVPGEEAYHFQPRLFAKINPEKCKYQVLSSKVEIRLCKVELMTWSSLEFDEKKALPQKINVSSDPKSVRPSYPFSKTKADWDKLEAEVKKEEKDEHLDGDAALNKFFRDIYGDADEDTRRAMQKSFVESNGTVLSTDWSQVGKKKVEGSPPDGMEMRKWEY